MVKLLTETHIIRDYERAEGLDLQELARIAAPAFLVYGQHSNYLSACDILAKAIPHAATLVIPASDHFDVLFKTQELIRPVRAFLAESWRDSSSPAGPPTGI